MFIGPTTGEPGPEINDPSEPPQDEELGRLAQVWQVARAEETEKTGPVQSWRQLGVGLNRKFLPFPEIGFAVFGDLTEKIGSGNGGTWEL